MIPQAYIEDWARTAPWASDSQVEQDLILSRVIVELFSDSNISKSVAFRGGTALHKLYLTPAVRYSEDIDLVYLGNSPIGPLVDKIRARLDPLLGRPRRQFSELKSDLIYRYQSEGVPSLRMKVKLEINAKEKDSAMGLVKRPFRVKNDWFEGNAQVTTYQIEELLGTKLRALYQRRKGRDLLDMHVAFSRIDDISIEKTLECFQFYLRASGVGISRAQFESNLLEKMKHRGFLGDVSPLLSRESSLFDMRAAHDWVMKHLISSLPGEPWKGNLERS